ncbi:MAG: hypothetical protein HWD58_00565 [Bacteroidota bacterium]|nr:MAG: hypothetical protein HWD58_00565 [Bacteroidota bacterium]
MKYTLAISPCPNDTFIFEHLIASNQYEVSFEDIETLNSLASAGQPDIVKISYAHYFSVAISTSYCVVEEHWDVEWVHC